MIDTGSTRSFISPTMADIYFSDYKYHKPFEVVSTHARSQHTEAIYIPLLKIFKTTLKHKFYVYDVDKQYVGVIGSDLPKELDASIDMKNQVLRMRDTVIPIIYNPPRQIILEPRSETRVNLPSDLQNGDAILEFRDFGQGVRMKCTNYNAEYIKLKSNPDIYKNFGSDKI